MIIKIITKLKTELITKLKTKNQLFFLVFIALCVVVGMAVYFFENNIDFRDKNTATDVNKVEQKTNLPPFFTHYFVKDGMQEVGPFGNFGWLLGEPVHLVLRFTERKDTKTQLDFGALPQSGEKINACVMFEGKTRNPLKKSSIVDGVRVTDIHMWIQCFVPVPSTVVIPAFEIAYKNDLPHDNRAWQHVERLMTYPISFSLARITPHHLTEPLPYRNATVYTRWYIKVVLWVLSFLIVGFIVFDYIKTLNRRRIVTHILDGEISDAINFFKNDTNCEFPINNLIKKLGDAILIPTTKKRLAIQMLNDANLDKLHRVEFLNGVIEHIIQLQNQDKKGQNQN